MDFYLKTDTEAELWAALDEADLATAVYAEYDEEGNGIGEFEYQLHPLVALDIIGAIVVSIDEETTETIPGCHANLRVLFDITEEQVALLPTIEVNSPVRVWA